MSAWLHFPAQLPPLTTIWFLSAILPPGLLEDTNRCKVIDEGMILYLSVSLLGCQCDEDEIKGLTVQVQEWGSAVVAVLFSITSFLLLAGNQQGPAICYLQKTRSVIFTILQMTSNHLNATVYAVCTSAWLHHVLCFSGLLAWVTVEPGSDSCSNKCQCLWCGHSVDL